MKAENTNDETYEERMDLQIYDSTVFLNGQCIICSGEYMLAVGSENFLRARKSGVCNRFFALFKAVQGGRSVIPKGAQCYRYTCHRCYGIVVTENFVKSGMPCADCAAKVEAAKRQKCVRREDA